MKKTTPKEVIKRSPMNLFRCSKKVQAKITQVAQKKKIAKWLLVEKLLDGALGVTPRFDAAKWLKAL